MKRTFNELNFKNIDQQGLEAWSKIYKGFVLFVARENEEKPYVASLQLGNGTEIAIPNTVDDYWLCNFDGMNADLSCS